MVGVWYLGFVLFVFSYLFSLRYFWCFCGRLRCELLLAGLMWFVFDYNCLAFCIFTFTVIYLCLLRWV